MKQHEAVIQTLEALGGVATLGQLNQDVFKITECQWGSKTPFASIRRIVQTNKNIYKIKPGLYGLAHLRLEIEKRGILGETDKLQVSAEVSEFDHSYYQGLLLELGKLRQWQTFVPNQDKNRHFLGKKLGDISTLPSILPFSWPELVTRSATIDVIWFNDRNMPHAFFEVEHSTDIQNSLLKFNDLRDFYTQMVIVADERRKAEFDKKLGFDAFGNIKQRVNFYSYAALGKQYEHEIAKQSLQSNAGFVI